MLRVIATYEYIRMYTVNRAAAHFYSGNACPAAMTYSLYLLFIVSW